MRVTSWVKFILLSILVFIIVLVITYGSEILDAIKAFPLDWLISYLFGAATMFLASFKFRARKQKHDADE